MTYLNVIAHPFNTGNTQPGRPAGGLSALALARAGRQDGRQGQGLRRDERHDLLVPSDVGRAATVTAQYVELVKLFAAEGA